MLKVKCYKHYCYCQRGLLPAMPATDSYKSSSWYHVQSVEMASGTHWHNSALPTVTCDLKALVDTQSGGRFLLVPVFLYLVQRFDAINGLMLYLAADSQSLPVASMALMLTMLGYCWPGLCTFPHIAEKWGKIRQIKIFLWVNWPTSSCSNLF